ncbi:hypothetical protein EXN66_Car017474 [Channa argus]|uniref:Uncharacterized protein n=1 Tax=Channa argus TaxID=215402 RepID=A0A6G1QI60_CHAAH|nr:hypothetical protein EXN66_Car017474 [Channa argus]
MQTDKRRKKNRSIKKTHQLDNFDTAFHKNTSKYRLYAKSTSDNANVVHPIFVPPENNCHVYFQGTLKRDAEGWYKLVVAMVTGMISIYK